MSSSRNLFSTSSAPLAGLKAGMKSPTYKHDQPVTRGSYLQSPHPILTINRVGITDEFNLISVCKTVLFMQGHLCTEENTAGKEKGEIHLAFFFSKRSSKVLSWVSILR